MSLSKIRTEEAKCIDLTIAEGCLICNEADENGLAVQEQYAYVEGSLGGIFRRGKSTAYIALKDESLNEVYIITLLEQEHILQYIVNTICSLYNFNERTKVKIQPFNHGGIDMVKLYIDGREMNWARAAIKPMLEGHPEPLTEDEHFQISLNMTKIGARLKF